jgi:inhibitor of cysteine peptidase
MSDETIRVLRGKSFEVALDEPAATGHRWKLTHAPPQVVVVEDRYETPVPGGPMGSPGRRLITLRATETGHYRVKFELARPWEAQPAAEHYVDVDAV